MFLNRFDALRRHLDSRLSVFHLPVFQLPVFQLSAFRQALVLLGVFSLISITAWGGTYWLIQREMARVVDARLSARMEAALQALAAGQALPLPEDGETIRLIPGAGRQGFWTDPEQGEETRYLQAQTPQGLLQLSENTERQDELRDILAAGMQISLLGSLLAAGGATLWMARRSQRRLNAITDGLAEIAQGRLDRRIPVQGSVQGNDDLGLVARRINLTADRLEQAMTDMRVQSSNIAHDLRTPLARLRAEIERAQAAQPETGRPDGTGPPAPPGDLGAALEQIDRITETFDALLRLSRIESGAGRAGFGPVALGALLDRLAETYGPVIEAEGQQLRIDMQAPAKVQGDADLLMQLLANLIQNALRYGSGGATVSQVITLRCHGGLISVSDQGPGIPLADRDRVLQPLYQQEQHRQGPGFGLGLSLVRAIAELHSAQLSLSDGPEGRGLTVTVRFPGER